MGTDELDFTTKPSSVHRSTEIEDQIRKLQGQHQLSGNGARVLLAMMNGMQNPSALSHLSQDEKERVILIAARETFAGGEGK